MRAKQFLEPAKILVLVIIIIIFGLGLTIYSQVRVNRLEGILQRDTTLAILVTLFQDDVVLNNQIFYMNQETGQSALLDMPPETGAIISSLNRVARLDSLFDLGNIRPYLNQIESFTGLPVPYQLFLDLDDISELVDYLGGLELFITYSFEDLDDLENLTLLPSGNVLLDGEKTLVYLTYEDPGETAADRASRFQKFVQSLFRKMGEQKDLLAHPSVAGNFRRLIQGPTVDEESLVTLTELLQGAETERVIFQRVLGAERQVDGVTMLFPHYNGNLLLESVRQIVETLAQLDPVNMAALSIALEIRNGTSRSGLASRTAELYRGLGYEISAVGNADRDDHEETLVVANRSNYVFAERVAEQIRASRIVSESDNQIPDGGPEVIIILGQDFDGRYVRE